MFEIIPIQTLAKFYNRPYNNMRAHVRSDYMMKIL